jgi:hypothetical protein
MIIEIRSPQVCCQRALLPGDNESSRQQRRLMPRPLSADTSLMPL